MKLTTLDRASRKEAYASVRDLKSGGQLPEGDIDRLLNYLAPPLPKTAKTAFQWVAKAAGKNDLRKYLNSVHVDGGVMYASDGHRIHWAPTELGDGYYDARTELPFDLDSKYPDVRRTVGGSFGDRHEVRLDDVPCGQRVYRGKPLSHYLLPGGTHGRGYDSAYLHDALNGADRATYRMGGDKVRGESEFGEYIVMGIHL